MKKIFEFIKENFGSILAIIIGVFVFFATIIPIFVGIGRYFWDMAINNPAFFVLL